MTLELTDLVAVDDDARYIIVMSVEDVFQGITCFQPSPRRFHCNNLTFEFRDL